MQLTVNVARNTCINSQTSCPSSHTKKGWLYRKKPTTSTGGKWKKVWCVLTSDYLTFYKNPDERVPKDFLLLKDFDFAANAPVSSKSPFGLVLVDKLKQATHHFYAEQGEAELHEWAQALAELRLKLAAASACEAPGDVRFLG